VGRKPEESRQKSRRGSGVLAAALSLCAGGCVERALLVRTDPPGARVWVNGKDRGTTPVRVPYVYEGRFDVRVEKEGYESAAVEVTTPTRLDAVPGPDFFAENGPWRIRRETPADIRLVPLRRTPYAKEELEAIKRRGEDFRAKARAAATEPGTPAPTRPEPQGPPPAGR